ncbi:MAG: T9SS type A sorting domain-containing protein [Bacteroidia bacterium]|nr:T9SS type A sorting domain-containing protein [Bacteroidia bacterium]
MHTILPTDSGYILGLRNGNGICLVDFQANIQWIKTFYDQTGMWVSYTGSNSPNALKSTGHNTFIAGGLMQNGGPTANKVFSVKYSSTFDTLYLKLLLQDTVTTNNYVNNSFINNTGNYVFFGHSGNSGLIIQTDTNSNFLDSSLILKDNEVSWFNAGLQMGNYYYLFGGTYCYAPVQVTGFDRLDGWVIKTDILGNEISDTVFGNPILFDSEFKFVLIHNNLLVTSISSGNIKHSSGAIFLSPKILILNENLSLKKEIKLNESVLIVDTMYRSYIEQIVVDFRNNLFVLKRDSKFNVNTYINGNTTSIVKLDSLYNICYSRNYTHIGGQFNSEIPLTMSTTTDGGYVFGGFVTDYTLTPSQQSWLVKTDSLGCDGFHSCNDTALVCQIIQAPDTVCKNDTSWLQVKFKGRSAPYFIYANNTLALDSVYYPYTLPLWIDTLVPYYPTTTGMQQVIVKVNDPWGWNRTDTVQIFVKNCGAGNIEEVWYPKKVEIYPNPATNELHVKIRSVIATPVSITIYDMQGKSVKQIISKQSENMIDISELQQGVYGVKVNGNGLICNERFVKVE